MIQCIDCARVLKAGEEPFSVSTPSSLACMCEECAKKYASDDEIFARLRSMVRGSHAMPRHKPPGSNGG